MIKFRKKFLILFFVIQEYLPANLERRQHVLERKRLDYWNLVKQYYDTERDEGFQDTYRQIHIDIPRMSPLISLFQQTTVQFIFERILYIWAIRHPASGYVQVCLRRYSTFNCHLQIVFIFISFPCNFLCF